MNNIATSDYLQPINDTAPCGSDLRGADNFGSAYYQLKNARTQARQAERQRMQAGEREWLLAAEWQPIAKQASTLLKEQSKDLEIASWLTESWVRVDGLNGLAAGLNVLAGLVEQFGADLAHGEADGMELQLATVQGLSGEQQPGTLISPLMCLPITQVTGEAAFAVWHYQQALELAQQTDPQKREKRIAEGAVELHQLQQAARHTDPQFGEALKNAIEEAFAALAHCDAMFSERFAEQAPTWHHLKRTLEEIHQVIQILYPANSVAIAEEDNESEIETPAIKPSSVFSERETALNAVEKAADYFLIHEPHSPIAYTLQQVVRWADLSLPELMQEIFTDMQSYYTYSRVTGIPLPDRPSPRRMMEPEAATEEEDND